MNNLKKIFKMWLYGGILILCVEMGREFKVYANGNFNETIAKFISISLFFAGPILVYLIAKDYAKIDLNQQNGEPYNRRKSIVIAAAIALGCIGLIAAAFIKVK